MTVYKYRYVIYFWNQNKITDELYCFYIQHKNVETTSIEKKIAKSLNLFTFIIKLINWIEKLFYFKICRYLIESYRPIIAPESNFLLNMDININDFNIVKTLKKHRSVDL